MAATPPEQSTEHVTKTFELKSAQLALLALVLKSVDMGAMSQELLAAFGQHGENPDFFDQDPLVLDFSQLTNDSEVQDLQHLLQTLRNCNLVPVAFRGANPLCEKAASALGLAQAESEVQRPNPRNPTQADREVVVEHIEVVREVPGPATMVVDKPLRSGQKVYARGADLVVLAMVNQGAEVVADGNIHVYAALRGKAMAGARGNTKARIFSLVFEPELVSIAGVYRTSENAFSKDVHGKAAQVRLSDDGQEKLLIEALKA